MVKINKFCIFNLIPIFVCSVTPLCSSTVKKSSTFKRSHPQHRHSNELFPPPPPEFLYDTPMISAEKEPKIQASGPGLKDGIANDYCSYSFLHSLFCF